MSKKLFLLDGMALVYRAHFALIRNPIMTSTGINTSALHGFVNTVLDILTRHEPTHLAVAFDTSAPTVRHEYYPEYKAQREEMPEDLRKAIPNVVRLLEAFNTAKHTAWQTVIRITTTGLIIALMAGAVIKLKLFGGH